MFISINFILSLIQGTELLTERGRGRKCEGKGMKSSSSVEVNGLGRCGKIAR